MEETITFNLRPLIRYTERGTSKVYERIEKKSSKDKIQTIAIEKRYQIDIIVAVNQEAYTAHFERYKLTLNRSGIIEIEKSDEVKMIEQDGKKRRSKLSSLLTMKRWH